MSVLQTEIEGGIATLIMNRPEALNALNGELSEALQAALRRVAEDRAVRCVVITGAGRAFSSGADLTDLASVYAAGETADLGRFLRERYHPIVLPITEMDKPVIAAVNGMAAGAGSSLALACDMRIASDEARFFQAFIKVGLVADSGANHFLPHLVGLTRAMELALTGDIIDAETAERIGLVNRVVPHDDLEKEVRAFAERLAAGPTLAYAAMRKAMRYGATHGLAQTLEYEAELQSGLAATFDHKEGVTAFLEKRPPAFEGR